MDFSQISDAMWQRHAHPLSVWSRLLSTPLAFVPLWNRSWKQGLAVGLWFVLNPFLFPVPKNPNAWATRAIHGEREWVKERPFDRSFAIQSVGSLAFLAGFFWAYKRRLGPVVACAGVVMACNAWFLDRMARTTEIGNSDS